MDQKLVSVLRSLAGSEDFDSLVEQAVRQSVTGLLAKEAESLPAGAVSEEAAISLALSLAYVRARNAEVDVAMGEIMEAVKEFSPVVMKGPAVASRYPDPSARECGDIDLYFRPEVLERAVAVLSARASSSERESDGAVIMSFGTVAVEAHPRYFDCSDSQEMESLLGLPSREAELFMMGMHIFKHSIGAGIGLKQLLDMAVTYSAFAGGYDREKLLAAVKKASAVRWWRCMDAFLTVYLGAEGVLFPEPSATDRKNAERLLSIVRDCGSFGFGSGGRVPMASDRMNADSIKGRKWFVLKMFLKHLPFSLSMSFRQFLYNVSVLVKGNLRAKKD